MLHSYHTILNSILCQSPVDVHDTWDLIHRMGPIWFLGTVLIVLVLWLAWSRVTSGLSEWANIRVEMTKHIKESRALFSRVAENFDFFIENHKVMRGTISDLKNVMNVHENRAAAYIESMTRELENMKEDRKRIERLVLALEIEGSEDRYKSCPVEKCPHLMSVRHNFESLIEKNQILYELVKQFSEDAVVSRRLTQERLDRAIEISGQIGQALVKALRIARQGDTNDAKL